MSGSPVAPYLFKGGSPLDYKTVVKEAGTWCTQHIPSGQVIQSVVPAADISNLMRVPDLIVGLLNLGVGVYSAIQIRKLVRQSDTHSEAGDVGVSVAQGFSRLDQLLRAQAHSLDVLLQAQGGTGGAIARLRREMSQGFDRVIGKLEQQEAEEFERLCVELSNVWKRFAVTVERGEHSAEEQGRLISAADKVQAWAEVRRRRHPAGEAVIQPYVVAIAMARRAIADAQALRGSVEAEEADRRLEDFANDVASEARAFCEKHTLYGLAHEDGLFLGEYVYLIRGLQKGVALSKELTTTRTTEGVFKPEELVWDRGLDEVREVFEVPEGAEAMAPSSKLQLKTIADYQWYVELTEQDPSTFDVHSKESLSLAELSSYVGAPDTAAIRAEKLEALKVLALPKSKAQAVNRLASEFGWLEPPRLADAPRPKSVIWPSPKPAAEVIEGIAKRIKDKLGR